MPDHGELMRRDYSPPPVVYAPPRRETARMDREHDMNVYSAMRQAQIEEGTASLNKRYLENRMLDRRDIHNLASHLSDGDPALLAELTEMGSAHHEGVMQVIRSQASRFGS